MPLYTHAYAQEEKTDVVEGVHVEGDGSKAAARWLLGKTGYCRDEKASLDDVMETGRLLELHSRPRLSLPKP